MAGPYQGPRIDACLGNYAGEGGINGVFAQPGLSTADIVVLAVSHNEFKCVDVDIPNLKAAGIDVPMIYDIKGFLNPNIVDFRL